MSDIQPEFPSPPRQVDYFPAGPDEVPWQVSRWPDLAEAFDLTEDELPAWHNLLANPSERCWLVIRRIYGVMAHFGEAVDEDDMEEWDWKKLAKQIGVREADLHDDLAAAISFWRKDRVARRSVRPGEAAPAVEAAAPGRRSRADADIGELLARYRFGHIKGDDRVFVADRLLELGSLFDDPNRREAARQLVNMELNLHDIEHQRTLLKARLEVLEENAGEKDIDKSDAAEVMKIRESLEKNEERQLKLFDKYRSAAAELGAEEIEAGELRKVAIGTISQMIAAQQEFYASGDRSLIDGMFTAREVVWLTTPQSIRPAQYRPDIVERIREAMRPENLWNGDYKPTPIPREASRRLIKLARNLAEEEEPAVIPEIDEDSSGDGEEETVGDDAAPEEPPAPPEPAVAAAGSIHHEPESTDVMVVG